MIEYVTANYVWILGGLILVLLIIIGYYADKTNFGQGEQKEETKDDKDVVLLDKSLSELVQSNKTNDDKVIDQEIKETTKEEIKEETKKTAEKPTTEEIIVKPEVKENKQEKIFEEYEAEIEKLLPDKDIISRSADDLLNDINNFSLDKTQKLNLSDIPDLDDVDLPRIKKLKKEDEDIWKI